ncbi:MAG: beta-1,4-xylanase [Planctomycetes bacterium]|nr:beta-1,4-xylanase [Planctomycetota bacterium]
MMISRIVAICAAWGLAAGAVIGAAPPPALPPVPEGLGVNIHFTDPKAGEMKMLAEGGFRIVRMDLGWGGTEREKGKYDFSAYDRLLAALEPHGIRALFILDYSNRHYDGGASPCTDEGRQAFARWAAAAAQRFKGRGILWEMYNEPNIKFWKPQPKVEDYVLLALEVGKALRAAAPGEAYIGPATSQIDFAFLEACFKAGLLEYWSAVSVHPYRQKPPETAAAEYARLRGLIDQYAPKGKYVPIYSGEWGYSCAWKNFSAEKQGKYLPRQWLVNISNNVPISIWYDWHDDGKDPKEAEHNFGTVANPYFAGREPVYDPKPAYKAARALAGELRGLAFSKRLAAGGPDDYVLLFAREKDVRLAAWTAAEQPREVVIPASRGRFKAVGHLGEALAPLAADAAGLRVTLTDAPQYLAPEGPNDLLRAAR